MNESILELWKDTAVINLTDSDYKHVLKFSKYMDKNSLWLAKYNPEKNSFLYSNDGQRIEFILDDIKNYIHDMEQGKSFPWQNFKDC